MHSAEKTWVDIICRRFNPSYQIQVKYDTRAITKCDKYHPAGPCQAIAPYIVQECLKSFKKTGPVVAEI